VSLALCSAVVMMSVILSDNAMIIAMLSVISIYMELPFVRDRKLPRNMRKRN